MLYCRKKLTDIWTPGEAVGETFSLKLKAN